MSIIYTAVASGVEAHNIGKTDVRVTAHDAESGRAAVSLMLEAGNLSAGASITAKSARDVAAMLIAAADAIEVDAQQVAA